jgi:hypothetical protein
MTKMSAADKSPQQIAEQFSNFTETMEELRMLRSLAQDLKSYRKMIKLKRND